MGQGGEALFPEVLQHFVALGVLGDVRLARMVQPLPALLDHLELSLLLVLKLLKLNSKHLVQRGNPELLLAVDPPLHPLHVLLVHGNLLLLGPDLYQKPELAARELREPAALVQAVVQRWRGIRDQIDLLQHGVRLGEPLDLLGEGERVEPGALTLVRRWGAGAGRRG